MKIEQIIRDLKFDINQMTILKRDGFGLPKLQEFINAAVDFAIAAHEHSQHLENLVDLKSGMNVSFDDVADQDDLNDRVPEPLVATPKGLTIKEESDDDLQQSCSKIKSSRSTRALKKIDINFHPSNKLSMDAANHDEQEAI